MRILCVCGSLRRDSFNRKLLMHGLDVLRGMAAQVRVAELDGVPLYNADLEEQGMPPAATRLREDLAWSQGVVIATPEYNNSIPGVLKNAIDWASTSGNHWDGKIVAVMGATVGSFGTVQAQAHLRHVMNILNAFVVPSPFVYVPHAREAFDADGLLVNQHALRNMEALLARLIEVTRALTTS